MSFLTLFTLLALAITLVCTFGIVRILLWIDYKCRKIQRRNRMIRSLKELEKKLTEDE